MWADSGVDFFIWVPIQHGYATLREVEEHWTLLDCMRALAAIRTHQEVERLRHAKE